MRIRTETIVGIFMLAAIGVFFYMSFQIGALRFDRGRYNNYSVHFFDVSGLARKADVKIAGVKVGWVDNVEVVGNGEQVKATILIAREFQLHDDAYCLIRQDGLLGGKHLELVPGDPTSPVIQSGGILVKQSRDPVSIDEILYEFRGIAKDVSEVAATFKQVLGGNDGVQRLQETFSHFSAAADRVARLADDMDRMVHRNEGAVDGIMQDIRTIAQDMRTQVPLVSGDIHRLTDRLGASLAPAEQVIAKINDGRGILGTLINDEEASGDLRVAINGVRSYFSRIERLAVVFDSWGESMQALGNRMAIEDAKGYFNVRIYPNDDYFYLAGYVGWLNGKITRYQKYKKWYDGECHELIPDEMALTPADRLKYAREKYVAVRQFDMGLWNLQFGKIYGNFAFRFGMFESTFGLGIDCEVPLPTDKFRWVSTFEVFDIRGRNRFSDDRPHLKWLNRVFLTQNIYGVFGADDFISRNNKNAFFGAGIRFADDDVKYVISRLTVNT